MRNCQMRFTITRAVSGFSRDASQFAKAVRRPVVPSGISKPALTTRRNCRLHRVEAVVRIAHAQDIALRRSLARIDERVGGGQRIAARSIRFREAARAASRASP